ncbi:MAG: trans-2-enoyl-CoA reductase family protein [Treponema sp.]|nr:trans-2-enoyl-CoA reductase family protein [Treponema sp.]
MSVKPMVRNNICLNAHPQGCKQAVLNQIEYTKKEKAKYAKLAGKHKQIKNVLVLGCSNGYGLASRIVATFAYGADTIGVSLEKEGTEKKFGTPGWYNNLAFDMEAKKAGYKSITIDGDAFSDEIKTQVIEAAKSNNMKFDLVVYSLASPVRTDPSDGVMYRSVLKPFGAEFTGVTIDTMTGTIKTITAEKATQEEADATVKVMGGEDWERWIDQLSAADVLEKNCMTVAYSYIGPEVSQAIYRRGTIGKAKEHLEKTAKILTEKMKNFGGQAFVSVNKGLVTRSSSVIPIIPLYLSVLFKVMKEMGNHEGCIEQINRLFAERLYVKNKNGDASVPVDENNLIRIDDWEMSSEVQKRVNEIMPKVNENNIYEVTDLIGYRHDFLATSGFDIEGVDYEKDVERYDVI